MKRWPICWQSISENELKKITHELRAIVGRESVLDDPGDLTAYDGDAKVRGVAPLAVALATTTEQVQAIVRLCARTRTALIPRGAGTGVVGGATPEADAIVLDLSRMNKILSIDATELLAEVEPGVITGDLQQAVEKKGLLYPPDPASHATSTVGGNAATNAGGLRAVKYGVTSDWIRALDVVLADGQLIHTGARTRKSVVGYDLTGLFIGSEGTLGVITGLTLRLIPKPPAKATLLALFKTLPSAGEAVQAVLRGAVTPAAMELMDATALAAVREKIGDLIPPDVSTLLIDLDGTPEQVQHDGKQLSDLLKQTGAVDVHRADSDDEAKTLWSARRALSPALYEVRSHKVAEDVTVPVTRIVDLFTGVADIAERFALPHACYGHAGDGNVHVNLLYDPQNEDETNRARQARPEIFRLALDLGGTISGEHGIGISKREFMSWEQGPTLLDLQRRLKRVFDPLNILNPGKVFP